MIWACFAATRLHSLSWPWTLCIPKYSRVKYEASSGTVIPNTTANLQQNGWMFFFLSCLDTNNIRIEKGHYFTWLHFHNLLNFWIKSVLYISVPPIMSQILRPHTPLYKRTKLFSLPPWPLSCYQFCWPPPHMNLQIVNRSCCCLYVYFCTAASWMDTFVSVLLHMWVSLGL